MRMHWYLLLLVMGIGSEMERAYIIDFSLKQAFFALGDMITVFSCRGVVRENL